MTAPTVRDRRVLITGGAGFVGRHLADALRVDNDVRVLDDGSAGDPDALPDDVSYVPGDVRDEATVAEATEDVDLVFHEAAVVSVARSVDAPGESHAVNLTGTVNVLEAARRRDARVVFASSAAVYGQPARVPIAEDDPTGPLSPYGLQKLSADRYVRLYADLYGLETVALRYFNIYGPGQTGGDYAGVITVFLDNVRAGEPLVVHGDGTQTRDFVHVSDVVQANLRAATTDAVGEAYNVGTGRSVSIRELAETVRDAAETDVPIEHGPAREGDVPASRADISKARERLGYEPRVDLADGLAGLLA
jgi:UDP-glucose 4-epimerase